MSRNAKGRQRLYAGSGAIRGGDRPVGAADASGAERRPRTPAVDASAVWAILLSDSFQRKLKAWERGKGPKP